MNQANLDYQRIEASIKYLTLHFKQRPSLEEIAGHVHLSPEHFQKMFSSWAGVSPKKFMQFLSIDFLREKIHQVKNVSQAAELAGYSSQSRVYDLFVNIEGVTPAEYKNLGKGLVIHYGFHQSPFGNCLLAKTDRGICALSFVTDENKAQEFAAFEAKWGLATLIEDASVTEKLFRQIFRQDAQGQISLFVQGTNFQLKVWEALLRIPSGELSTYGRIADEIKRPKAVRAVGTAAGKNPVAFLIPCHRVIRKEGKLGEYRWGSDRKKVIVGWEMAQETS